MAPGLRPETAGKGGGKGGGKAASQPGSVVSSQTNVLSATHLVDMDENEYSFDPPLPFEAKVQEVKKVQRNKPTKMDKYSEDTGAAREFFKKEPCIYTHRMFDRAAKIFEGLTKAKEEQLARAKAAKPAAGKKGAAAEPPPKPLENAIPPLDFKGPVEKKLTFELAFSALKYQSIFDDMLDDCAFFSVNVPLRDHHPQVHVVLYDYQSRKFQPRTIFDGEDLIDIFNKIEAAILNQKTKLAASLARRRIKASAPNIEFLLPDGMRGKGNSQQQLPTYCWVNTTKISAVEMLQKIRDEGFTQLWTIPKNLKEFDHDKSFFVDPHCNDVLVFSVDASSYMQEHALVEQAYLVRQDKSSCLAALSVLPLMGDEQDVVVFNPGSGLTAAHVAVLLRERKGNVVVMAYQQPEDDYNKMMRSFELIGVTKNIRVIRDLPLDQIDSEDHRFLRVRAALVMTNCSKSAISNIVNYIVTEGENLKLLQDLAETSGELDERLQTLTNDHSTALRHGLSKLTRIHGVAYVTRSTHEQENDLVVSRAIEWVNVTQMAKKLQPWRVIPPVVPFTAEEIDEQIGIEGKYMRFKPTSIMNGCFIACIAREPEDPAKTLAKRNKPKAKGEGGPGDSMSSSGSVHKGVAKKGKKTRKGSHISTTSSANKSNNNKKFLQRLPQFLPFLP